MVKRNAELLEETKKLDKENKKLQQQLQKAKETIDLIKTGDIDALVVTDKKNLKVYTEKTADKTYRILIEKMHEGAVTLNKDGTILYCNMCFANMANLPLQKVIGEHLNNFIEDSSKEHFEALLKKGWDSAVKEEINIHTNNGKTIPVLMSVNTLELDNDVVLSIILTDLTLKNENQKKLNDKTTQLEWKNTELKSRNKELAFQNEEKEKRAAELIIANKELVFQSEEKDKRAAELRIANTDIKDLGDLNIHKETVLATLSHDLRSPLAGIIGTAEHLKNNFEKLNKEDVKELLELLYKESTNELNMLDYLVEWARIKYAAETFLPEKIKLSQYVKKVFDTLNENAVAKNISLLNEIKENEIVFADGKMLLSILQNLVSNAIKHTLEGGKITITAQKNEDKIIVEVKDTGIGMSKEMREKLFAPQMKALSKARNENNGAGIGLLLVKNFLEKMSGEIWVESEEGKGSSFYFTLPVNKPEDKIENAEKIEVSK